MFTPFGNWLLILQHVIEVIAKQDFLFPGRQEWIQSQEPGHRDALCVAGFPVLCLWDQPLLEGCSGSIPASPPPLPPPPPVDPAQSSHPTPVPASLVLQSRLADQWEDRAQPVCTGSIAGPLAPPHPFRGACHPFWCPGQLPSPPTLVPCLLPPSSLPVNVLGSSALIARWALN